MMEMKLNCHHRSDRVQSMNKIRQENDMTYRIGTIYTENKIELSPPIGLGVVYEENKIEKQHDRSYRYGLH